jgi:transaldolase
MSDTITASCEQARHIFRALNGIGVLLKKLPATPENGLVTYAIMSNMAVIQTNLVGMSRANPN